MAAHSATWLIEFTETMMHYSLVYDLMEPLRPIVDKELLTLINSQVFTPKDFVYTSKGTCRLNPRLAKLAINLLTDINSVHIQFSKIVREAVSV